MAANPDLIVEYAARTREANLPEWRKELRRLERSLARLVEDHDRVRRAYRNGADSLEEYERSKAEIAEDRRAWEARAETLRAAIADEEQRQATVDRVGEVVAKISGRRGTIAAQEKRAVPQKLGFHVAAYGGPASRRVRIEWAGAAPGESEPVASLLDTSRSPSL